jgi:hypothetical protein
MGDINQWELLEIVDGSCVRCPKCRKLSELGSPNHDALKSTGACISCYSKGAQSKRRKVDSAKERKHAHYFKDVSGIDEMDTYLLCRTWQVKDDSGALHHALKKMLDAGKRGNKDKLKDVTEARDTLNRYLEIEAMFSGEQLE